MLRLIPKLFRSNIFLLLLFCSAAVGVLYFNFDNIFKANNNRFAIKKIEFDGNDRVPEILLLKTSGLRYKSNICAVSLQDVKKRLENIAWIRSAIVQRKLPDTIYIRVAERIPIAILQSKQKLYLVDADGVVLEHDGIGDFDNLPIVVGEGAGQEAAKLLNCLDKFPKIRKQLAYAIRIGKRRWDIKINRAVTVKLPEKGLMHALGILDEISDNNGFFHEDISAIDLRPKDRIIISKKKSK